MGSEFNLIFYASNDSIAKVASDSVFRRINYLNAVLSDYLDGSETNRLSATAGKNEWFYASNVLFDIIQKSLSFSKQTNGAFDVSIGSITQLWRRAMRRNYFPEKDQVRFAKKSVGYRQIVLNEKEKAVLLRKTNTKLDFGAIGKGYAADQALKILTYFNIKSALLDAGGDLAVGDAPPNEEGWEIKISSGQGDTTFRQTLFLKNCGVATSGQTYRFIEHNRKKYSHIVNPQTGVGLLTHIRTTVIAPDATTADVLATAFSVLELKKAKK